MLLLVIPLAWAAELQPATFALGEDAEAQLSILSQLKARADLTDEGAVGTVRVRRLRVDAKVTTAPWTSRLTLNLAPGSLELIEAWSGGSFGDAMARVGVLKAPFTQYRDVSFADLGLVEWSPVTRAFGSERQVGASLAWRRDGWDATGAVTQGQGVRTSHGLGVADVYGVSPCGWSSLAGGCALEGVAPELFARAGWAADGTPQVFDDVGGALRGGWTVSAAVDTDPSPQVDLAARVAAEGTLAVGGAALHGAGYLGWAALPEGWAPALVGARAELTWLPSAALGLVARASVVDALPALEAAAGQAWSTMEVVAGPTVPIRGSSLRVQADGGWLRGADGGDTVRLQAMLQAGF